MDWRPFSEDDIAILNGWFQDAETTRRLGGMLPLETWYAKVAHLDRYHVLMAWEAGEPLACVVLETFSNHTGSLAIVVNPAMRNQGYGKRLLRIVLDHPLCRELCEVHAGIEADHLASQRCFVGAGFMLEAPDAEGFIFARYIRSG